MPAQFQIVGSPQNKRKTRSPRHNWNLKQRPWQIQPFMIAPVLPGETLKNLTMQARVVSDPIVDPLVGWWCEHYVFYVKLRDLYARDLLTAMLLKPETDISSLNAASDVQYYHSGSMSGLSNPSGNAATLNWPKLCVESIVDNYFRYEGEAAFDFLLNGMPAASVSQETTMDSATLASDYEAAGGVDQDLTSTTAGQGDATAAVFVSEIEKAQKEYAYARLMKTTDMTFEDWCAAFGVAMPKEELFKPELVRYSRDWTYPSNTIDPTNGTPRSAVSWSVQVRADKDRYFKEPGFLVGVCVVRPKVYFSNLRDSFTILMNNAYAWLPPAIANMEGASFLKVLNGDGPAVNVTEDHYVDIKDLLLYGDQFLNYDVSTVQSGVALPSNDLSNRRYPASTDADKLFVTSTAGVGMVRQDGVCELHILGRQVETSPSMIGTNLTV